MTFTRMFKGCIGVIALALGGCAGVPQITSEVSSFAQWPAQRAPGHYVFERLPSQDAKPDRQDALEAACAPALRAAGFAPADKPDLADVTVQLNAMVRPVGRVDADPFWPEFGAYGYRAYGRQGRWGPYGHGVWPDMRMDLPMMRMQLDVLIRDRKGNQVLYETHALYERLGSADARLFAPMCTAALDGFPSPAAGARDVTVTLTPDQP